MTGNPRPARGALAHAMKNHHDDIARELLEQGADPNDIDYYKDPFKRSALIYAITCHFTELVEKLLDLGADPNLTDGDGETPVMHAVHMSSTDILGLLIDRGARTDQKNVYGFTALHFAEDNPNDNREELVQLIRHAQEMQKSLAAEKAAAEAREKTVATYHDTAAKRQELLKNLRPKMARPS